MTFKDHLKVWNKGILKGAQRRFAEKMGVKEATVSHWANGSFTPDETLRKKISTELAISLEELMKCFPGHSLSREKKAIWNLHAQYLPVTGQISEKIFAFDPDCAPDEVLPICCAAGGQRAIALKVKGASIEPIASDQEYLLVLLQNHAQDGQLAIAGSPGKYSLKRIKNGDNAQIAGIVKYVLKKP